VGAAPAPVRYHPADSLQQQERRQPMERGPHGSRSEAHRPVVYGRNGMVCAGHPLAAQAGVTMLQRGGNAFDAALAVAATLNVVEPQMSGLGGDGFLML